MSSTFPPALFVYKCLQLFVKGVGKLMEVNMNDLVDKQLSYCQFNHKVT